MTNGRPSSYTEEIANFICEEIASTPLSLRKICDKYDHLPDHATVYRWLLKYESFRDKYARAKEEQIDILVDEVLEISDDGRRDYKKDEDGNLVVDHDHIARARLRVDSRKWLASKLKAKKYGDKIDVTSGGEKIQTFTLYMGDKEVKDDAVHTPETV